MSLPISIKVYKSNPPVRYYNISPEPAKEYKVFQGTKYAHRLEETANEWVSNIHSDVIFNHIYENNGWPYIVYDTYTHPKQKIFMLKIQFIRSMSTGVVSIHQFKKTPQHILNVLDPYIPAMFNGLAAIGNIKYEILGVGEYSHMKNGNTMYQVWYEILDRCFNPTHPYYCYFGNMGTRPRWQSWYTFRYFYKDFDTFYHDWDYYPNPNDWSLYTFPMRVPQQMAYALNKLPSPVIQHSTMYSYLPFDQRASYFKSQEPKKRGPKMLMYRVVKEVDL